MRNFETVFDFASAGYRDWPVLLIGLLFVLMGALQLAAPRIGRPLYPGLFKELLPEAGCVIAIAFGIALTGSLGTYTFLHYLDLRKMLLQGEAEQVEGPITNLRLYPAKKLESFSVGRIAFDFVPQFSERIREGSIVRVSYMRREILRIEVAN